MIRRCALDSQRRTACTRATTPRSQAMTDVWAESTTSHYTVCNSHERCASPESRRSASTNKTMQCSLLYDEHDTVSSATSSTSHFTARFTFIRIWRFINATNLTSSVAAGFGRHGMPPPASNPDIRPFDLETRMRDFANFPSKFGHASPLGSRIIRYAGLTRRTDGQTDGRTDKSNAYCPIPYWRSIIIYCNSNNSLNICTLNVRMSISVSLPQQGD